MKKGDVPVRPNLRTTPLVPSVALSIDGDGASKRHTSAAPASASADAPLDFERLYTEHFHHVSRWASALGGRSADLDDLTQEVFLVVRRRLPSYIGPSLPAWLYGITRKTVSDYRRRAWIRRLLGASQQTLDALPAAGHASGVEAMERLDAQRILLRILDEMSSVRRTAFILFEIEGYSGDEIAELEQVPLATVYTRLHHARKDFLRLTAAIAGDGPEDSPP
jgi:RNA polymerase sigma-70 factor (ECF subfamily)